ncbi:MAG: L-idonate 5-dehydrogenase, partial [Alphaproteobacteria bacterium]|nr:L-idonate 5-dehydrogenase [Alphaproteobacteria bacterium]
TGAAPALIGGLTAVRPRAVIVQLGMGGDMSLPMVMVTAKELDLRGSFRFHEEFATGIALMGQGLIDVKPLISHTVPLADAEQAFMIATDPLQPSLKTQIQFF